MVTFMRSWTRRHRWVLTALIATLVPASLAGCSSVSASARAACRAELEALVGATTVDYIGNPASAGVDTWEFHGYWDKDDEMTTASTYFTCVADATAATVSTDTTTDNAPPVVVTPVPDSTIAPCNFITGEGEGCAERRTEAQGPDPDACVIKGNVSFETGSASITSPARRTTARR